MALLDSPPAAQAPAAGGAAALPLEDCLSGLSLRAPSPQDSAGSVAGRLPSPAASPQLSPSTAAIALPAARVRPGPPLGRPPALEAPALEALRAQHGREAAAGAAFFAAATVEAADGRELGAFVAGDPAQGALMLYDVDTAGSRSYARVLVRAIYTLPPLGGPQEVWMLHHYLFNFQEEAEYRARHGRGDGGAAALAAGELSLSAAGLFYFSPMHLIADRFAVEYSGAGAPEPGAFRCVRAFDPTTGAAAPLPAALAGLRG